MAIVFIPTMLQKMTGGAQKIDMEARNVRQVIERLEELYPGIKERLVEDGEILPNLAIAIDGDVAIMGMVETVGESRAVHVVRASGGCF